MGSAMLELFAKFIKENLEIKARHTRGKIEILIKLGDEIVSYDFIDYIDVVRIVERENNQTFHYGVMSDPCDNM